MNTLISRLSDIGAIARWSSNFSTEEKTYVEWCYVVHIRFLVFWCGKCAIYDFGNKH